MNKILKLENKSMKFKMVKGLLQEELYKIINLCILEIIGMNKNWKL
jgi:hypothetical protein